MEVLDVLGLQYVFSESICPLSDRFLSLETCTRSLYSEKMFQGSINTPPPSQIGNTNGEIVIQVVRTDAASIWATGRTWWQIPAIAKVTFTGALPRGVTGKDVIVALCGLFSNDEVLNHAIEFTGSEETMRSLPVDARLTIANMTTEWGKQVVQLLVP